MSKYKLFIYPQFEMAVENILNRLTDRKALQLSQLIDTVLRILDIFPEGYPLISFDKHGEIPYRKATISKEFVIVYFFERECIHIVNLFHTSENWKYKIL